MIGFAARPDTDSTGALVFCFSEEVRDQLYEYADGIGLDVERIGDRSIQITYDMDEDPDLGAKLDAFMAHLEDRAPMLS